MNKHRANHAPAGSLSGLRVLVAEDDMIIAELIREILLDSGCKVIGPVGDPEGALQAIRANAIDGALVDVRLGTAKIDPVANELAARHIPFILMSGQALPVGATPLLRRVPLLQKPFSMERLCRVIENTFRIAVPSQAQQP
jgi:DNA-binding NtrC family response regulator